jgi:hypothetical protein
LPPLILEFFGSANSTIDFFLYSVIVIEKRSLQIIIFFDPKHSHVSNGGRKPREFL